MLALLHDAHALGAELVVYPELALTTFFPRWYFEDERELDAWFETEMPSVDTKPLFDEAARLGVGFCLGFAELTPDGHRYNTQILVGRDGHEIGRYRKVHLPGHDEHEPWRQFQHLEKRYFEVGPDGFQVWRAFGGVVGMAICNDRRWPEAYRVLGLQGAELDPHRVQHAGPQPARARARPARRLPQPSRDAGGRVPERHVGRRCRQGRRRGGRRR